MALATSLVAIPGDGAYHLIADGLGNVIIQSQGGQTVQIAGGTSLPAALDPGIQLNAYTPSISFSGLATGDKLYGRVLGSIAGSVTAITF